MNILTIFYRVNKGGLNKRLAKLINGLCQESHSVHFISSDMAYTSQKGVIQHVLNLPRKDDESYIFWLAMMLVAPFTIARTTRRNRIDRIVTFGPIYTLLCAPAILISKVPAVTFIRADNMRHSPNRIRNAFFWLAEFGGIQMSKKVVFASNSLFEIYRGRYKLKTRQVAVLPNDVGPTYRLQGDLKKRVRESMKIAQNDFLVCTCGVFNKLKNFDFLLRTLAKIDSWNLKLMLIGDEAKRTGVRSELEKLSHSLRLGNRVIFTGWQEDPLPFIAACDIFVLPSKTEGSPNSLLEALSCGIPCLGSNIPPIREILYKPQLLFPLGNEDALAHKLSCAYYDAAFYRSLKEMSEDCANRLRFDWKKKAVEMVIS